MKSFQFIDVINREYLRELTSLINNNVFKFHHWYVNYIGVVTAILHFKGKIGYRSAHVPAGISL